MYIYHIFFDKLAGQTLRNSIRQRMIKNMSLVQQQSQKFKKKYENETDKLNAEMQLNYIRKCVSPTCEGTVDIHLRTRRAGTRVVSLAASTEGGMCKRARSIRAQINDIYSAKNTIFSVTYLLPIVDGLSFRERQSRSVCP